MAALRENGLFKQAIEPRNIRATDGSENNSCRGQVDVVPGEYVKGAVPHDGFQVGPMKVFVPVIAARSDAWGWIPSGGKYDCADLTYDAKSGYKDDRNFAQVGLWTPPVAGMFNGQIVQRNIRENGQQPSVS